MSKRKSPSKRVREVSRVRSGFSGVQGVNSNYKKAAPKKGGTAKKLKKQPRKGATPKTRGALSNFGSDYIKGLKTIGSLFK